MTVLQLLLLVIAGTIFYLFFRQLFSGNYPRRGVDFEQQTSRERLGGLMQPDKTFRSVPARQYDRIGELIAAADDALEKGDNLEAKKALQSAQILAPNDPNVLRRLGVVYLNMHDPASAREVYEHLLQIDPRDDLAESSLANALHLLGEEDAALQHHERAIALDPEYAPHYFNYANTLYDLGHRERAREAYEKAFALDANLAEARTMIEELRR
jgi:tetratricopeptide (TPR) repeat protein